MKIIDCKAIAADILNKETVEKLKGKTIHIILKPQPDDGDLSYLKAILRTAKKYGVGVKIHELPEKMPVDTVLGSEPLPSTEFVLFLGYKEYEVVELVTASQAIPDWLQVLDPPCSRDVVAAVDKILQHTLPPDLMDDYLCAVVIGKSELAKHTIDLLESRGVTVTCCHSKTHMRDLARFCRHAEIIISFAGVPGLINCGMLSVHHDQVMISVGCSVVDGKLQGDLDLEALSRHTRVRVTNTPGGVGVVTTAMLFEYLAG